MDPNKATGVVLDEGDTLGSMQARGTCFAFQEVDLYVTAAHCVTGMKPTNARVIHQRRSSRIRSIACHPEVDLAVMIAVNPAPDQPFFTGIRGPRVGEDFVAFGYPEDTLGDMAGVPTARLFKGHVQRFLNYAEGPYRFFGAEMSIPSPAGLSGGPLIAMDEPSMVIGMAAANRESTTYVERYEGAEALRSVVQYGTAVVLGQYADWIEQFLAARR